MPEDEALLSSPPAKIERGVPLAPLTSLALGGPAEHFVRATSGDETLAALRWAKEKDLPVTVLGGGSNVVVSDAGVEGLVLSLATRGVRFTREGERVIVTAEAGESWDELVASTVEQDLAGLECLSGIPGSVGATPIQNVGAYGREVSELIRKVQVLDRATLESRTLEPSQCAFRYRHSVFKAHPQRFVVQSVSFVLEPEGAPALRYAELENALAARGGSPSLRELREAVLALRRGKSMVLDPADENGKSVGSFFENPLVSAGELREVERRVLALGLAADPNEMPRFVQPDGRVKLAAGWLVERAGMHKGTRRGNVGLSTRHALALVHHGGGTSQALAELAREVRERVQASFGVRLEPEPVFLGWPEHPLR